MPKQPNANQTVDLLGVVNVVHEYLTPALIQAAYGEVRVAERERLWTLEKLVQFWTAVAAQAPDSLSQALRFAAKGGQTGYPDVDASPQAFFQRCQSLDPAFFARVFRAFVRSVAEQEPPCFAQQHAPLAARFSRLLILDGSDLDPVARLLKGTRGKTAVPIPGQVLACYDLRRGTLADLLFEPSLRIGELTLARQVLATLEAGALVLADRLYGTPKVLGEATAQGLLAVFRRQPSAKTRNEQRLSFTRVPNGVLEDWRVELGVRARLPARLVRLRIGDRTHEFLTNVLDPAQLSAQEVAALYRDRWQVERLFQDLKEVLNLKRFYCGNSNAVAMQVYACAIVHTAMRTAQGRIAQAADVPAEVLSTAKLFPLLAAISARLALLEAGFLAIQRANPRYRLTPPDWRTMCAAEVALREILADQTRGKRPRMRLPPSKPGDDRWQELPAPPSRPRRRK